MKPVVLLASFSLTLLIGCSVPKYQPTEAAYHQAVVGPAAGSFGLFRSSNQRGGEERISKLVSTAILGSCNRGVQPGLGGCT